MRHFLQKLEVLTANAAFEIYLRTVLCTGLELVKKRKFTENEGIVYMDKTSVIDIKPYTSRDRKENIKTGWLPRS